MITPLIKNHPDPESIDWKYQDKDLYMEMEDIMVNGVTFFEPFLVNNFYPDDMFNELVDICNSHKLAELDYSNQMNKWEEQFKIPQKFIDYAVQKTRELIGTDDIHEGYHMYAHHQITDSGRVPRLPLHIDWSPGSYMVDLHIGGNREWGFVAGNTNFITKPNQAIICQPQFDYHYRPDWSSDDVDEYYQVFFFHLVNKNHWSIETDNPLQNRSKDINKKYEFGPEFRNNKIFSDYQYQRQHIFDRFYHQEHARLGLPNFPKNIPTPEDTVTHDLKNINPASKITGGDI